MKYLEPNMEVFLIGKRRDVVTSSTGLGVDEETTDTGNFDDLF